MGTGLCLGESPCDRSRADVTSVRRRPGRPARRRTRRARCAHLAAPVPAAQGQHGQHGDQHRRGHRVDEQDPQRRAEREPGEPDEHEADEVDHAEGAVGAEPVHGRAGDERGRDAADGRVATSADHEHLAGMDIRIGRVGVVAQPGRLRYVTA
jgi:hypothetical protein